jgi:hypothetical protein
MAELPHTRRFLEWGALEAIFCVGQVNQEEKNIIIGKTFSGY